MSVQTPDVHDVAAYAAAVRRALVGLGPEQIDDLTDGLEADLAEALDDAPAGADVIAVFGTPEEYAAELGAAAGLAPLTAPVEESRRRPPQWLRHPLRALVGRAEQVLASLRRQLWWPPFERFFVALRPVWWVLRGWVIYQLVLQVVGVYSHEVMPTSVIRLFWLGVLVVASVQWGRGQWRLPRRWQAVPGLVSVIAAVAALPVIASMDERYVEYAYAEAPYLQPSDGVYVDGMQVSNLFAYDAEGNPLEGVQLFDDRGRPVRTTYDEGAGQWYIPGDDVPWQFAGVPDEDGRVHWNVYPLLGAHADAYVYDERTGQMVLPDGVHAHTPPRPFAKAPAIIGLGVAASDEPASPPTSPAPDASAPPTPSPSAAVEPPTPEPDAPTVAPTP